MNFSMIRFAASLALISGMISCISSNKSSQVASTSSGASIGKAVAQTCTSFVGKWRKKACKVELDPRIDGIDIVSQNGCNDVNIDVWTGGPGTATKIVTDGKSHDYPDQGAMVVPAVYSATWGSDGKSLSFDTITIYTTSLKFGTDQSGMQTLQVAVSIPPSLKDAPIALPHGDCTFEKSAK